MKKAYIIPEIQIYDADAENLFLLVHLIMILKWLEMNLHQIMAAVMKTQVEKVH